MHQMDYRALFDHMHPGFFDKPFVRNLGAGQAYEEMALFLADFSPDAWPIRAPGNVTFGLYEGDRDALRRAVALVNDDWPRYFGDCTPVYCAMAGDEIASFCIVGDFGMFQGLKIGGPGCVGTVPAYRRQGIGLSMVRNVTGLLRQRGYDLSCIHYTAVGPWYAKLGYQTVLRWDREGFLPRQEKPANSGFTKPK